MTILLVVILAFAAGWLVHRELVRKQGKPALQPILLEDQSRQEQRNRHD